MTAGNDFDPALDQPTLFSARVTPHRSLNRTGFTVLMGFIGIVSFVAGMAFCLMGAWPVLGLFGLDVLVIYWAFRVNFRSADATERRTAGLSSRACFVTRPTWAESPALPSAETWSAVSNGRPSTTSIPIVRK